MASAKDATELKIILSTSNQNLCHSEKALAGVVGKIGFTAKAYVALAYD